VRQIACVSTRVRLDAALCTPEPARLPQQNGRPRKKGKRLPTLSPLLAEATTAGETITIDKWYGAGPRKVAVTSDTAVWYHRGTPVVPMRWGLLRDPTGRFAPQALVATDQALSPQESVASCRRRWQREGTVAEARAHLGIETQRPWNARAMARTTPALVAL
jgi:hypothetical protein